MKPGGGCPRACPELAEGSRGFETWVKSVRVEEDGSGNLSVSTVHLNRSPLVGKRPKAAPRQRSGDSMRPRLTGFRSTSRRTPPAGVRALPMRRVIVKEAPQKFVRRPEYSMCSTNWFACKNLAVLLIATSVWSQANKAAPVTPPAVATPATAASPVNSDPVTAGHCLRALCYEDFL